MADGRMSQRLTSMFVAGLVCGIALAGAAYAQGPDDLARLLAEVSRLHSQGKYDEAIPVAERAVALARKRHGERHRDFASAISWLAFVYSGQGRHAEAEALYQRGLSIAEKALGPNHPDVATALNNLALLYKVQGRHGEAEPLYKRSLSIRENALGNKHPEVAASLINLALLYQKQGRYAEAEQLLERSLAIRERASGREHPDVSTLLILLVKLYEDEGRYAEAEVLHKRILAIDQKARGPEHPHVATSLDNLARLYDKQGRYAEAEPLYKRSLAISEKARGPNHPDVGIALNNLAELYHTQGRYAEAEPLYKRSLAIVEKTMGREHPEWGTALNNLAEFYRTQGRYAEAEPLCRRSLAIREKALGPDQPEVADSLNNLALLYMATGRLDSAEPLLKRALAIREKALGPDHPEVGASLGNLAGLYESQGRHAEAAPLRRRDLAIVEKALGPDHPTVATSLNNLAALHAMRSHYPEAEQLFKRSLAIREKALGSDHPEVGDSLNNLAMLASWQTDWTRAVEYWRGSTAVIQRRTVRGLASKQVSSDKGEARSSWQFSGLIRVSHRLAAQGSAPTETVAAEMFETAQWAQSSEAAASLAQMTARSAKGSPQLAGLVRERQDLVSEWQAKGKLLIAAKTETPAKPKVDAEKRLADRLAAIDTRLAEIDRRLALDFPDYAALARPVPNSVAEVRAQLGPDEALVLFLDMSQGQTLPEETFIWLVTKMEVRWVRSDLGTAALGREMAALRCGLDATAWEGDGAGRCAKALNIPLETAPGASEPLPFDHARAHKLYLALFGEVQDLIKGKHLLIVPSGPVTQLPFQVLVTKPPASGDHRKVAWLAREHAVTILPAVSSLKALRRIGNPSTAPRPMIGFGNPLLDGPDGRYAALAKLAGEKQHCPEAPSQRVATLAGHRGPALRVETRGGLADVSSIKREVPLPETADELCAVARYIKAGPRDIRLGTQATEREIKRLSATGELAKYRMVHFATHGVLAGQLDGTHEPGLILTPPDNASEEDDGYLSASEVASLKLDADWVILSACNTAAGGATSAQALSGLARAFIYAQARALLVSHWAVYSDATVKLITAGIREMAADPKVGRAEAMRRSMLALIDKGEPHEAHPAYWAPFVVVGEGAAER